MAEAGPGISPGPAPPRHSLIPEEQTLSAERPMETYRRERNLRRTLRRVAAWMIRFHEHGDAGAGEVPELLASLRRALRRREEEPL